MKIIIDLPWALEGDKPEPKPKITFDGSYVYRDEKNEVVFEHVRWKTNDKRGKTFSFRHPDPLLPRAWVKGKPEGADRLLWMVPNILANPTGEWWWTEGEKDAKALYEEGIDATSHHGGAGSATLAQARWLAKARRVVLVVDKDAPGADCALRRYRLLRKVGLSREQVHFRYAAYGKDAAECIQRGGGVPEDFLRTSLRVVKRAAADYSPSTAARSGYVYVGRVQHDG